MKIHIPIKRDPNRIKSVPIKKGATILIVVLIFVSVFSLWLFGYRKINKAENLAMISMNNSNNNSDIYLKNISEIMYLPDKSKPRVFEITDSAILIQKQIFYRGSEKGDILFVFDESKKAILYSPTRNKIINTGGVEYNNESGLDIKNIN